VADKEDGTLGRGIPPQAVNFSAAYVAQGKDVVQAVQGHQVAPAAVKSSGPSAADISRGKVLMTGSDCAACHAPVRASVGPSWQAVATRYKYNSSNVDRLANKIIKGGGGVWGEREMAAHPQISKAEASQIVSYILSFSEKPKQQNSGKPLNGTFAAKEHVGKGSLGYYLFTASYKDKGANGMSPLTSRETITLRHPLVRAAECDSVSNAARGNREDYKFIKYTQNRAFIVFRDIDLTDIGSLTFELNPKGTSGKIELRLGAPDGPVVGATPVLSKANTAIPQGALWATVTMPVEATKGVHDLYLVLNSGTGLSIWSTFDVDTILFNRR
jgi:cytochrome c